MQKRFKPSTGLTAFAAGFSAAGRLPLRASDAGPDENYGCRHIDTRRQDGHIVCSGCGATHALKGGEWVSL